MKYWFLIAAAVAIAACSPGVSRDNLPAVVAAVNNGSADYLFEDIPGAEVSARVENGDTLVLKVTNVPYGTRTFDPNPIRAALRPEVCNADSCGKLIEQGGKVRLEFVSNFGKELPAIQFAHCG